MPSWPSWVGRNLTEVAALRLQMANVSFRKKRCHCDTKTLSVDPRELSPAMLLHTARNLQKRLAMRSYPRKLEPRWLQKLSDSLDNSDQKVRSLVAHRYASHHNLQRRYLPRQHGSTEERKMNPTSTNSVSPPKACSLRTLQILCKSVSPRVRHDSREGLVAVL